jgi:hypothetical protein
MKFEDPHASTYGSGAKVAAALRARAASMGITVDVHHIGAANPRELAPADLYVFSSPGRMGKPIRGMRRFLKDLRLPAGTRYALLTTEMAPRPDPKTGRMPSEEEICRFQRVRPVMRELLRSKGMVEVAEDAVFVTDIKGPLEEGWQAKVERFAARLAGTRVGTGDAASD